MKNFNQKFPGREKNEPKRLGSEIIFFHILSKNLAKYRQNSGNRIVAPLILISSNLDH